MPFTGIWKGAHMSLDQLTVRAAEHLQRLCVDIPTRTVGSQGNRDATSYVAGLFQTLGWRVEMPAFQCMDWSESGVDLNTGTTSFEALASPYTLPVLVSAPLVVLNTVEELEAADLEGKIALLRGDLAREQLAPKNFPWWNPDEHKRIIAALERGKPAAILAATSRNPQIAGAVYPFPLIEDGDFDIPSAYMTEEEGQKLAVYAGREVNLEIRASRSMAEGFNVVARRGGRARDGDGEVPERGRWLVTAHIDAKLGTPGAVDNATGVIVLLLLGELLGQYAGERMIELVVFNGEDYYAAPGERLYLQQNEDLSAIDLVINIDGAGYFQGDTHFSLYECPESLAARARTVFSQHVLAEGPQWYQGDHSVFVMAGRPAIAITSDIAEVSREITHTPKDNPEIVDSGKVAQIARAIAAFVGR
jgi:aminopeptidase YwaD